MGRVSKKALKDGEEALWPGSRQGASFSRDHAMQDTERLAVERRKLPPRKAPSSKESQGRGTEDPKEQVWCRKEERSKGFRCKQNLEKERKP